MQKFFSSHLAVSALALLTVCGVAHADLKVVQTTRIDSPQIAAYEETMTPQQKAAMAKSDNPLFQTGPHQTTVYEHGRQIRTDIGSTCYIINSATRQTITLNRRNRNYTTQPYRTPPATGQLTVNVKDTGQTKTIAGHLARHYVLTATLAAQPGTLIQGDIWAASDVPQPTMLSTGSGPFAVLQSLFHKIKGYPLKSTIAVTGSPLGSTTVTTNVISVSKAPLSDALFAVPAGYTKLAAAARG